MDETRSKPNNQNDKRKGKTVGEEGKNRLNCYSLGCHGNIIKIVRVHTNKGNYDFPCCKRHEQTLKESAAYSHFPTEDLSRWNFKRR
jgi:hypothetical protein